MPHVTSKIPNLSLELFPLNANAFSYTRLNTNKKCKRDMFKHLFHVLEIKNSALECYTRSWLHIKPII